MIAITDTQRETVKTILAQVAPGVRAHAFGSRVAGTPKPYSDLDLALSGPVPPALLADLREAFESSELPFRVDLVALDTVSQAFRDAIAAQLEPL